VIGNLASFTGFERNYLVYVFWTMGKYSKKNLRGNWQEEDLQNAMRVVRAIRLSTNAAAIHYKVPRRTLRAYLAENKQCISKLRRKIVLLSQQEKELSKRIIRLAQTGYPITLTLRRLMSYIYGTPILDVSRSHTTTQHSQ